MPRICFPHPSKGEFNSLREAYCHLSTKEYGWSWFTLTDIVRYNVVYRDYLRDYGIDALLEMIIKEVPELANDIEALDYLRNWASTEKIAGYDIQCYNVKTPISILGHTFNGLDDILNCLEIIGKVYSNGIKCFSPDKINICQDIHVGKICRNYPIFDSYDLDDDRTYQNFIFKKSNINDIILEKVSLIDKKGNFCLVHESIPTDYLPILYYRGDGDYMILATHHH